MASLNYWQTFIDLNSEFSKHILFYYNLSLEYASNIKESVLTTDNNFTKAINYFNHQFLENVISKYPELNHLVKKSGQTPVVLFASTLLLTLLSSALIYLLFIKNRRKGIKSKTDKFNSQSIVAKTQTKNTISANGIQNKTKSIDINIDQSNSNLPSSTTAVNKDDILFNNNDSTKITPSSKITMLDIDSFIRQLRQKGLQVQRIKHGVASDQVLRLNHKGEVLWSNSFFSKTQHITTLISAFNADNQSFLLEFKKRTLLFKLKNSEKSYTTDNVIKYFNAIVKKQLTDPYFAVNICKSGKGDFDQQIMNDDASSVNSDSYHSNNGRNMMLSPVKGGATPNKVMSPGRLSSLPSVPEAKKI